MPAGFPGTLSPLQVDLLQAMGPQGTGLFVTGGAALVGFYGQVRTTRDLDLFTRDAACFESAARLLEVSAHLVGAAVESLRTAPEFRRMRVRRSGEDTLVDLVLESVPAVVEPVQLRDGWELAVDQPEEIAVNKVCALVGRSEPRDLWDLYFLAGQGIDLDRALEQASLKDGGVGPDTLLFVLQDLPLESLIIPGMAPHEAADVGAFFRTWAQRLRLKLLPD